MMTTFLLCPTERSANPKALAVFPAPVSGVKIDITHAVFTESLQALFTLVGLQVLNSMLRLVSVGGSRSDIRL